MAFNLVDVAKTHQFQVEFLAFTGNNVYKIQEFTPPDIEVGVDMHGGTVNTPDIKTPTRKKIGVLKFKILLDAGLDNVVFNFLDLAVNQPASVGMFGLLFSTTDGTGLAPINRWVATNCFFSKNVLPTFNRAGDSKNVMYECEVQCTDFKQL